MRDQKFARSGQLEIAALVGHATNEALEKARPFEPPVSKKLGVERTDNHGIEVHFLQFPKTCAPFLEKIVSVFIRGGPRSRRIVQFLRLVASCHPMIFDAAEFSEAGRKKKRP